MNKLGPVVDVGVAKMWLPDTKHSFVAVREQSNGKFLFVYQNEHFNQFTKEIDPSQLYTLLSNNYGSFQYEGKAI